MNRYECIDICGELCLFTEGRVDKNDIIGELFVYELSNPDENNNYKLAERVNDIYATVISNVPFDGMLGTDSEGNYMLPDNCWGFLDDEIALSVYQEMLKLIEAEEEMEW